MNSAQPDISVITVNYNGYHDTCEFIDSWVNTVTSVPYEIIVVDNGSTANEGLLLQQKYPSVHVIRSEQNLGFAGGNNLGIKSAKGNYLFLLNNDTLIVKDTVYLLIKRLLSSKGIAGISPLILNYTEPHTIQFAGYTPLSSITLRNRTIGRKPRQKLLSGKEDILPAWCCHAPQKAGYRPDRTYTGRVFFVLRRTGVVHPHDCGRI